MSSFKLRPHHGVCIYFFVGKGYSEDFTANMTEVVGVLKRENPELALTVGEDVICRCCPHNIEHRCESFDKVTRYDNGVLKLCGLNDGDKIHWNDFSSMVYDKIISAGQMESVCGGCNWRCYAESENMR